MGLLLCLTGLVLFGWGAWPAGKRQSVLILHPHEMQLALAGKAQSGSQETARDSRVAIPAILEMRRLVLETPGFLRPGDPARVRLGFRPDPDLSGDGNLDGLSNLYDTHFVAVEARLEIGGLLLEPSGTVHRPLAPGQSVDFEWVLLPEQALVYQGTAWLYLRFLPKDGSASSDWPLVAQRVKLTSISVLGLSGRLMRWLGGMGALSGVLLLVDLLFIYLKPRPGISASKVAE
jgi:hypothetical protein